MTDIVVVSNRGPVSFRLEGGRPVASSAGGGLAGTLRPLLAGTGTTWVAAALGDGDRLAAKEGLLEADGIRIDSAARRLYQLRALLRGHPDIRNFVIGNALLMLDFGYGDVEMAAQTILQAAENLTFVF